MGTDDELLPSDIAFTLWLDSLDPEVVYRDLRSNMTPYERRVFRAASERAWGQARN